jgi:hypothetical protein
MSKLAKMFLIIAALVGILYNTAKTTIRSIKSSTIQRVPAITLLPSNNVHKIMEIVSEIENDDGSVMPLVDYLDNNICGACALKCALTAPRCGTGVGTAARQTDYYYEAVSVIASKLATSAIQSDIVISVDSDKF